jgi:hypothetical protein
LADTDPAMARVDTLALAAQRERWQTFTQFQAAPVLT